MDLYGTREQEEFRLHLVIPLLDHCNLSAILSGAKGVIGGRIISPFFFEGELSHLGVSFATTRRHRRDNGPILQ